MAYIIKPLVTEEMTSLSEKQNKFGFIVRPDANKLQIKAEVEAMYNVTVTAVNTMNYAARTNPVTQRRDLFVAVQMPLRRP